MTANRDLDAERALLGALIIGGQSDAVQPLDAVRSIVRGPDFFDDRHRTIFEAICRIADRGADLDPITLASYVARRVDDPKSLIVELMEAEYTVTHVESYAGRVRDHSDRRGLIEEMRAIEPLVADPMKKNVVGKATDMMLDFEARAFVPDRAETFGDDLLEVVGDYDKPSKRLLFGIDGIDQIMNGTPPGSLNLLAARPGGGKTTFAQKMATHFAEAGHTVDYVSLEMDREQLIPSFICARAGLDSDKWDRRRVTPAEMSKVMEACGWLQKLDIRIHDPHSMTLDEFRSWAHRRASKGSRAIILDYLQLLEGDTSRPRYEQFAEISRVLKKTARRIAARGYDCRLFVLSQMNRDIEKAKKRKPQPSDLRESGTLEQDADSITFLHSLEREGVKEVIVNVEVIIAKHRSGKTGSAIFEWNKATRSYRDRAGLPNIPRTRQNPKEDDF